MYPFIFYNTHGATTTITKHLFVNGEAIADIQGSGATTSTYYLHTDQLRGTNVVSNSLANIDQLYSYYPYGATRVSEKNGSFTEQRQFIGQEYDVTGLNYLNARYYDGSRGQFLSEDPVFLGDPKSQILTDPQSLNAYSYSEDNPITKKDPQGTGPEMAIPIAWVVGYTGGYLYAYGADIYSHLQAGDSLANSIFPSSAQSLSYAQSGLKGGFAGVGAAGAILAAPGSILDFGASTLSKYLYTFASTLAFTTSFDIEKNSLTGQSNKNIDTFGNLIGSATAGISGGFNNVGRWPSVNPFSGMHFLNAVGQGATGNIIGGAAQGGLGYLAGKLGVGNTQGKFTGTYNFGGSIGTINFGTGK